ncbi:MAG TPA: helix-turn-helix domain-containing protein [Steroidobacteraceae bacterium]|nr:helix-turn-helix domain-containing protein [Steroidobacteraceae bacterium]
MDLASIGRMIAARRRTLGVSSAALAAAAGVGRSTLAALEAGKLPELGFNKVARICQAAGIILEAHLPLLDAPLMRHRHLTEAAGRDLTKAAVEDVILRGDINAWRGLARALRTDKSGRLAGRVRQVAGALGRDDPKVAAFAVLLPGILAGAPSRNGTRE